MIELLHGDCLQLLQWLDGESIDLVLTDPPYGATACKWDSVIPFEPMWKELLRVAKPNAAICLFGSEPFSSKLRLSNLKMYKYDWTWDKKIPSGAAYCKRRPMQQTENISVFCQKVASYYPLKTIRQEPISGYVSSRSSSAGLVGKDKMVRVQTHKNPTTLLTFRKLYGPDRPEHPTQKPVDLLEYLIKTYTREGETVLDFTMGSGSTGVACRNLNRHFIGIEKEKKYFEIAKSRIANEE